METLESLRRRIQSAQDLYGIIRTMKALAAASIRQFEQAVEAVDVYTSTVDTGLRIVLQDQSTHMENMLKKQNGGTLAIIFGTDQGMCGQFNENIISFTLRDPANAKAKKMIVGQRAGSRVEEAGSSFERLFPVPSSVEGINPAVQSLLLEINLWRERASVDRVILYYNRPGSGSSYQPVRVQLIPVDMSLFRAPVQELCPSRSLPMYTMEQEHLLSRLVSQYLFAQLYRAYAESLASENASRLMTMQAAEKNIEERLDGLNAEYHGKRQGAITSELLDIVSGVEAIQRSV
ncbi:MAG TPA: F0F1 ATP synthase subunit gamma [Anaerolineales bacterium]|nr:F0F1 ATP synthase subunit gamma [Anaerolineales bacterium]